MIIKAKVPVADASGNISLMHLDFKDIPVNEKAIISLDGSTTNTGIGILRLTDGAIMAMAGAFREQSKENPIQYKVRLKRELGDFLESHSNIVEAVYEEPFLQYATAASNLFMLRTSVEELKYEREPLLDYLVYRELGNQTWKKRFMSPDKCTGDSENQKKLVRDRMLQYYPWLEEVTQDEIDALAMGFVARTGLSNNTIDDLVSSSRLTKFEFSTHFIGGDDDSVLDYELPEVVDSIPEAPKMNGLKYVSMKRGMKWEDTIYRNMGAEDKVLLVRLPSKSFGNLAIKYRIGHLTNNYTYVYALVWRKNRKK